jgi:hypothetical protein
MLPTIYCAQNLNGCFHLPNDFTAFDDYISLGLKIMSNLIHRAAYLLLSAYGFPLDVSKHQKNIWMERHKEDKCKTPARLSLMQAQRDLNC